MNFLSFPHSGGHGVLAPCRRAGRRTCRCPHTRPAPWRTRRPPTTPAPLLSLTLPLTWLPCSPNPSPRTSAIPASGRRTMPAIPAAPEPASTATSSAPSTSSLWRTESVRGRPNRPHRPRLLRLGSPPASTSASPTSRLRPRRPRHHLQGEPTVLPMLSTLSLSLSLPLARRSAARRRSGGHRSSFR